jgi:hypothetical protein
MTGIENLTVAAAVVTLALLFSAGAPAEVPQPPQKDFFAGLKFQLIEETEDADIPIPSDHTTQVDFRSTLVLRFEPPEQTGEKAPDSPAWTSVLAMLDAVNEIARQYAELNARSVDIDDPSQVRLLQEHVRQHDARVIAALPAISDLAEASGRFENRRQFVRLLNGQTAEPGYQLGRVYENLALFLTQEIKRLQASARSLRRRRDNYEVTVIAIRSPIGAQAQAIHVDPYDNLPAGQLDPGPLGAYGIHLTEQEMRRFRMEVEMNTRAAEAIREVMANGDEVRSQANALAKRVEAKIKAILDSLELDEGTVEAWQAQLDTAIEEMIRLEAAPPTPQVAPAARQVADALRQFRTDLDVAARIVTTLTELHRLLTTPTTTDLFEVVAGPRGVFPKLDALASDANDLHTASANWARRARTVAENAPTVGAHLANEAAVKEIKTFLERLPKTTAALSVVADYFSTAGQISAAAETLEEATHDQIYFDIDEDGPPDGVIVLRQYELNRGERIVVKVSFRPKNDTDPEQSAHTTSYRLEVEKLQLHHSIAASLIFARAAQGTDDATDWKPNVAAMVNWHYRHRDPEDGFQELWNWLNPGAGIHLASLDQGDDTAEFGIGPGFTFWNGLMHAGFGWNLSQPDDREYFFVGVNLFHLLDVARGATGEATWQREIDTR